MSAHDELSMEDVREVLKGTFRIELYTAFGINADDNKPELTLRTLASFYRPVQTPTGRTSWIRLIGPIGHTDQPQVSKAELLRAIADLIDDVLTEES